MLAPEELPLPAPDSARGGWAVPAGSAGAAQAVAMKHEVRAVFVWLGQGVTAAEPRLRHARREGRAVPSLHLLHGQGQLPPWGNARGGDRRGRGEDGSGRAGGQQ